MPTQAIPDGYTSVTPYLYVSNSAEAIEFYKKAFGAVETIRLLMPDGSIAHAEIKIGNAAIMMADENPQWGNKSPKTTGGPTCGFCLYVEDCDKAVEKAVLAGAELKMPVSNQFYGDRTGTVICPFGHQWTIATRQKDMANDEMNAAMHEWMKSQK